MIYLDNAATSWPKPPGVARAMSNVLSSGMGNPGRTSHRLSMEAASMVQECREHLAQRVERMGVGQQVRPGSAADRLLVNKNDFTDVFGPDDFVVQTRSFRRPALLPEPPMVKGLFDQCALPRTGDAAYPHQKAQRNCHVDCLQIVLTRARDR